MRSPTSSSSWSGDSFDDRLDEFDDDDDDEEETGFLIPERVESVSVSRVPIRDAKAMKSSTEGVSSLVTAEQEKQCCGMTLVRRTRGQWILDMRTVGQMQADGRKAVWHEEFYNLAWSAAVSSICSALLINLEHQSNMLTFFSLFLPLFSHWLAHQFYLNRFDNSDAFHNLYQLMNCALTCLAAANMVSCSSIFIAPTTISNTTTSSTTTTSTVASTTTTRAASSTYSTWGRGDLAHLDKDGVNIAELDACADFSYLMSLLRLFTALMYFRCAVYVLDCWQFSFRKGLETLLCFAGFLLLGLLQQFLIADRSTFLITWWAVVLADTVIPFFSQFMLRNTKIPLNGDLMIDRFGLFFSTVLGGAFIAATFANSQAIFSTRVTSYALSVIVVLISMLLMLAYHEGNRGTNDDATTHALLSYAQWRVLIWIILHVPLTVGVVVMNSLFVEGFVSEALSTTLRWYLCTALSVVVFSLTALQCLHKRPNIRVRISLFWRSVTRGLCAVAIVLLPIVPEHSFPLWALYLCLLALVLIFCFFDALGNREVPFVKDPREPDGIDLRHIFSSTHMERNIRGNTVSGGLDSFVDFTNLRLRSRDLGSSYL